MEDLNSRDRAYYEYINKQNRDTLQQNIYIIKSPRQIYIDHTELKWVADAYLWLSVRLQYLHCISNGDSAVLH